MEYLTVLGPIEKQLARQSYQMGQPLPDRIANAPELYAGLELYLQAFFDLDSERSHGMGITMIPVSRIRDYAEAYDFNYEQSEDLMYLIRKMDVAHTIKIAEKLKQSHG